MVKIEREINKKSAMTLAEVLITLGIVGVVCAFTIPTLIKNTQDAELKSAWKKEYSVISQAYMSILSDNGGSIKDSSVFAGGGSDSQTMISLFKDKMRVARYCPNTSSKTFECWHPFPGYGVDSQAVKLKNGTLETFWGAGYPAMILNDGALILLYAVKPDCTAGSFIPSCGTVAIDVNGQKKPNVIGRDIFIISILGNKLSPIGVGVNAYSNSCDTTGYSCAADYLYK